MVRDNRILEALEFLRGKWVDRTPDDGEQCIVTALGLTALGPDQEVFGAIRSTIREQYPERCPPGDGANSTIVYFNDHPDTTFDDIEAVMVKAALERGESL